MTTKDKKATTKVAIVTILGVIAVLLVPMLFSYFN